MNMLNSCRVSWNGFHPADMTSAELIKLTQPSTQASVIEQDGRLYDVSWSENTGVSVTRNGENKGFIPCLSSFIDFFERGCSLNTRASAFQARLNQLRGEQLKIDRGESLAAMIFMTLDQKINVSIDFPREFIRLEGSPEEKKEVGDVFTKTLCDVAEGHSATVSLLREKVNEQLRGLYNQLSSPDADMERITAALKVMQSHLKFISSANQNHKQIYQDYAKKIVSAKTPVIAGALLHRLSSLSDNLHNHLSSFSFNDHHEMVTGTTAEQYHAVLFEQRNVLKEINITAINSLLTPPALKGEGNSERIARAAIYTKFTTNFTDLLRDCKSSDCQIKEGITTLTANKRQLKHQLTLGAEITRYLDEVPPGNTLCLKHLEALAGWRQTCLNLGIFLSADNLKKIQEDVENCVSSVNMSLALTRCITSCQTSTNRKHFSWRLDALKQLETSCKNVSNVLCSGEIAVARQHITAITVGNKISAFLKHIDKPGLFNRSSFDEETQARINTLAVLKVVCYSGTAGKTDNNKALLSVLNKFEDIDFIAFLADTHMSEIKKTLSKRGWPYRHKVTGLTYEDHKEQNLRAKAAGVAKEAKQLVRMTMEAEERVFERGVVLGKLTDNTSQLLVSTIQFKEAAMKFRLGQTAVGQAVLWFQSAFK